MANCRSGLKGPAVRRIETWIAISLTALCLASCRGEDERHVTVPAGTPAQKILHTGLGGDFVLIPGTTVDLMVEKEGGRKTITLSDFYCARSVITKEMYSRFLKETNYPYDRDRFSGEFADNAGSLDVAFATQQQWQVLPHGYVASPSGMQIMEHLSWTEGDAFAGWLSKREGRPFSLISEAQARWVAGGGVARGSESFWWMATEPSSPDCWMPNPFQNFTSTSSRGFIPGSFPQNPLGVFLDISRFWTADWFQSPYDPERSSDPRGPAKGQDGQRVTRSVMLEARSGSVPERPFASVLLVSPVLAQDHREGHPEHEPDVAAVAVQPLPRIEVALGDGSTLPMLQIPAGTYVMGRPRAERPWSFEYPPTTFHMRPYWIGVTEVTQAQFQAVTGVNPSRVHGDRLPVHSVTMGETLAFTELLTRQERAAGRLGIDEEYRLPTEVEWERAARAGSTGRWSCGDDPSLLRHYAWFDQIGQDGPKPIATRWPNAWGFFDFEGNVLERCCHNTSSYPGGELDTHWIPLSAGHADHLDTYAARGGSFNMWAVGCDSTIRRGVDVDSRVSHLGFRLARGPSLPYIQQGQNPWLLIFNHDHIRSKPEYRAIMQYKGIDQRPLPGKP